MLCEISQMEKDKNHRFIHMWDIKQKATNEQTKQVNKMDLLFIILFSQDFWGFFFGDLRIVFGLLGFRGTPKVSQLS